jgi:AcrR family transcriptional regulator
VSTDDRPSRNTERTRRAILDSARAVLRRSGTGAAIGEIAREAQVSKSGLLHHFPSREALLIAVVEDTLDRLHELAREHVDLAENHPGKALRGYIRAVFSDNDDVRDVFHYSEFWSVLKIEGMDDLLRADAERWDRFFAEDGLHPDRVIIVRNAAEGFAGAVSWDPTIDDALLAHGRALLLALTEQDGPLLP